MQFDRSRIRDGMTVYSSDGEKLGKVLSCDASMFTIEKGFFFPKDYIARYDDISSITEDDIYLSMAKDTFVNLREAGGTDEGWSQHGTSGLTSTATQSDEYQTSTAGRSSEDVRMPVAEEELDVVKRDRQSGEVRLRKDVVTETKRIDVPVTREEVHVERVAATDRRDATGDEKLFRDETISVPVHEEEVEIRKRPVVKEEVRLRKDRVTEQRASEEDVRKERVNIEGDEGSTRRFDRTDDLNTTRRMDNDATGKRGINDPPYTGPGFPPDDT